MILYPLIRKALFTIPAEDAHHFTMQLLRVGLKLPLISGGLTTQVSGEDKLRKKVAGIEFPNPIGLAAGFDKNALFIPEISALGFGFVEIGTVTPKGQMGNPKPRLFRLPKDKALINRMGFNNDGADIISKRIQKLREEGNKTIIGGNIGKNKDTANADALRDYLYCLERLHEIVDYITVNVSSPNTPNLRELQDKDALKGLLSGIQNQNKQYNFPRPIFLKIAPDMSEHQLDEILEVCEATAMDGIIANNTTVGREYLKTFPRMVNALGPGGLSGAPLSRRSMEILKHIIQNKPQKLAVIASGGIMDNTEATNRLAAGADLIQLYTGFIYEGPELIAEIKKSLLKG